MFRPSLVASSPASVARGPDRTARFERTLVGAAMTVMAFVLERRVQGLSRNRSLASS